MELDMYKVDWTGTLLDAAQAIASNQSRCVIVMNGGKVVGALSEGDLLRALLRGTNIYAPMKPFICHGIYFLSERNLQEALEIFRRHGVSLVPVLNNDFGLEDVITIQQILSLVSLTKFEYSN